MAVKLLTEHNLGCLSLKGCCKGSSESTLVKMPHCWKSHVTAHFTVVYNNNVDTIFIRRTLAEFKGILIAKF